MTRFFFKFLILFVFLVTLIANSQIKKVGVPFITNYTSKAYKAASENCDVIQDSKGMMFFANHFGVLQFDGVRWNIVVQPTNKSMVRSLTIDNNNRIYIGAQGEIGYAEQQVNGQYHYTSLLKLIPENARNFGEVIHTIIRDDEVIFFSREKIFVYKNNCIKILWSDTNFNDFFENNNDVYVSDNKKGLFILKNDCLVLLKDGVKFAGMKIRKIFKTPNGSLVLTQKNGIYVYKNSQIEPFKTEADSLLKQGQISVAISLSDGYYAIGTRQKGLIIIDSLGNVIQHLNKQKGLQNDYVTNLKKDAEGNLWVTLKEGVDLIQISSPLSRIFDTTSFEAKIHSSQIYNDKLYVATDNGLFRLDWEDYKKKKTNKIHFEPIQGMSENVWNIGVFDDVLLAFENNGIFEIKGNVAKLITKTDGFWKAAILPHHPDILIAGGYSGLHLLKKNRGSWVYQKKIIGFNESCRVIEIDDKENIWIAHGYKGIYKIQLNKFLDSTTKIEFYTKKDGFPSSTFLSVYNINNQILFGTTGGVYKQDSLSNKMILDPYFKNILGNKSHVRLLKSDSQNNIWYVSGEDTGKIIKDKNGNLIIDEAPFKKLRYFHIPGFENIQTTKGGDVFFGTQDGLVHYNSANVKNYKTKYASVISEVKCVFPRDSLLFSNKLEALSKSTGASKKNLDVILPFSNNAVKFSFGLLCYDDVDATEYEYWLEGFEPNWSDWNSRTEKEYTNLSENEYIFHVRAKNIYNVISEEAIFKFEILPPWYRTNWAFLSYFLLFVILIYGIIRYQKTIARKERNQLMFNQEKELLLYEAKAKQQKLALEHQKMVITCKNLEATLNIKNTKLASNTVNLIHLNKILLSIKELINQINIHNDSGINFNLIKKIKRVIDFELKGEQQWNEFEEIFNQLHDNFMQRLKTSFPELTPRDMRLCAYLRMNFNTKEIAPLLGISVRGVEDTRYRIRKKLKLSSEINITEFILNF